MTMVCLNGSFYSSGQPLIPVGNRSFKWGDALFETMLVKEGAIRLKTFHFERLFLGLRLLQFSIPESFNPVYLESALLELCTKNRFTGPARARLTVYRMDNDHPGFAIEAFPLENEYTRWNEQGLTLGIFPYARKAMDAFSNLKSANFLPYLMAAKYASENQLDDAVVLNAAGRICDTSKASLFMVKKDELFTPSITEGCIAGVMRRAVIDICKRNGLTVHQEEISPEKLMAANEVFVTNAVMGVKWVKQIHKSGFGNQLTRQIRELVESEVV